VTAGGIEDEAGVGPTGSERAERRFGREWVRQLEDEPGQALARAELGAGADPDRRRRA
jgi:hypothetical protein